MNRSRPLSAEELRASLIVWGVVNAVCLLQATGFATRSFAPQVNPILGVGIVAAALPATYAFLVFRRARSGWVLLIGPLVFDAFVLLHVILVLFFGSIVLMGLPMFRIDRRRWGVTVVSATLLVAAMLFAMSRGVG